MGGGLLRRWPLLALASEKHFDRTVRVFGGLSGLEVGRHP
jgi:hypothetical protein